MTALSEEQVQALMSYIDARIDEKISDALGRDSLHETTKRRDLEDEMRRTLKAEFT